jgi:DNA modification methylase/predicted RNA-binding Zn-ribbon protein involved in translation (DUF1610 family)
MKNQEEEIKDLDKIEPIDYGVVAKPHTPVYKMHRYFARRPYTVFNELIKHYSNPGNIILDPMCGGGVTIVEGLRLKRKVIGVDLNPMAIFITRCEVMDVDLDKLKRAFYEISEKVKDEINNLYLTKCPRCKKETAADWFEWSNVVECPNCKKNIVFAETKKLKAGTYKCPHCGIEVKSIKAKRKRDQIIKLKIRCECGFKAEKKASEYDFDKYKWIENNFDEIMKNKKLWYPKDKIFEGEKTKELLTNGYNYFYELFTKRNLLALAILLKQIRSISGDKTGQFLELAFSSTLDWSSKISRVVQGAGREITMHAFWTPGLPCENNVWQSFDKRYKAVLKGKSENQTFMGYYKEGKKFLDLDKENGRCWLLAKSATKLRELPDESIDVIITDPPYGGNVNYTELSDFWAVWIKNRLGLGETELIDYTDEAIENKYQGKGVKEYRNLMYKIFEECHRVLKPYRWMVMTFHNRKFQIWNAIHLAAHDAGFIWSEKDGMIYQPPIKQYYTPGMLHGRAPGAMQGDFVLSYKKSDKLPEEKLIEEVQVGNKIRKIAKEAIEYHGGAKLSTIYMRVMPFLLNTGLLEKIKENDVETYLRKDFIKKDDKWYLKEFIDEKTGNIKDITIEEYAPVKARLESIIRRFLSQGRKASMDEILQVVYSRLINSNAAEYEEIDHVINRICVKVRGEGGRELYQLKEEKDKGLLFEMVKEKIEYSEESDHDVIIEQLVKIGKNKEYDSHIGQTEQKKDKRFREISLPMGSNVQYGLNQMAFNRIKEIDILWVKGVEIVAAFEVEKSTTIDSGITRFRELFAATPSSKIPAYIVIPDNRKKEAEEKIGSLANRRDGLTERIKYILFSDLIDKEDINLDKISKEVK